VSLCHGDFHPAHCIVGDARISAVVDWEKAWAGNSTIDLAMTHAYLDFYCLEEATARFLAGYAGSHSVPDGYEKAYLPVRMAQALGMVRAWDKQHRPGTLRRTVELYHSYLEKL
jgi:aminoglycoside phosphotransferase (APT) family kinase protein